MPHVAPSLREPGRPRRILLARHGRTRWNLENRRLGRRDVPLDDVGRAQALAIRDLLANEPIDAIYASPLSRARETAAPLSLARGLAVQIDNDLTEFDFGEFCGTSHSDVQVKLKRDYLYDPVPGGESLRDAWIRAERFAARVTPILVEGAHLLVVSHRRLNRLLDGVLLGYTLEETVVETGYHPWPGSVLDIWLDVTGNELRVIDQRMQGPNDASE